MLTDKQCRNAKCPADKKRVRLTDAHGLYLEVSAPSTRYPNGSKRWFQKLYVDGKDTRIALGSYPFVSIADARAKQKGIKAQRAQKLNPIDERRREHAKQVRCDTFEKVSGEWYAKQIAENAWADGGVRARRFLGYLLPDIGARLMSEIEPPELLSALRKLERRGVLSTAERTRALARPGVALRTADGARASEHRRRPTWCSCKAHQETSCRSCDARRVCAHRASGKEVCAQATAAPCRHRTAACHHVVPQRERNPADALGAD